MRITKFFRPKNERGTFDEEVYYAVDSYNVDFEDGQNLKDKMTAVDSILRTHQDKVDKIDGMETDIAENRKSIEEVEKKVEDDISELSTTKGNLSQLTGRVDTAEDKIDGLQTDMQSIKEETLKDVETALLTVCSLGPTSLTCSLPEDL